MSKCKITVLKRAVYQDLIDTYIEPATAASSYWPFPFFTEGQEFIVDGQPGADFCGAAWEDIYKFYVTLAHGGDFTPWMNREGMAIACCSDGLRPVFFKLERIAD